MRISAQESAPSRRAAHGHRHGATRGGGFGSRDFEEVVLHAPWIDFSDPGCFGKLRLRSFTQLAANYPTVSGRLSRLAADKIAILGANLPKFQYISI